MNMTKQMNTKAREVQIPLTNRKGVFVTVTIPKILTDKEESKIRLNSAKEHMLSQLLELQRQLQMRGQ
jgi:hypothetical protein